MFHGKVALYFINSKKTIIMKVGDVVKATIVNIKDFGALVDVDGCAGMIYYRYNLLIAKDVFNKSLNSEKEIR